MVVSSDMVEPPAFAQAKEEPSQLKKVLDATGAVINAVVSVAVLYGIRLAAPPSTFVAPAALPEILPDTSEPEMVPQSGAAELEPVPV